MSTEHEEEEKELPTPQVKGVDVVDTPFINLRDEQERQAYAILKDRVFSNMREFDPTLLEKTCLLPSSFFVLFKRMHPVFHFDFMEIRIGFHGRILVAPSVFIAVVLFLLSKLTVILIAKVFGKNFLVVLFTAS
jgi:hypothetical protein